MNNNELLPGWKSQAMFVCGGWVIIVGAIIGMLGLSNVAVCICAVGFASFVGSGFLGLWRSW